MLELRALEGLQLSCDAAARARPPLPTMGGMSFLNKKPWHPSTFRNEETKWLKEQRAAQVVKTEAEKADLVARETEQRMT